jgi:hypothetical protein
MSMPKKLTPESHQNSTSFTDAIFPAIESKAFIFYSPHIKIRNTKEIPSKTRVFAILVHIHST